MLLKYLEISKHRVKSLKKKNSDGVIFGEPAGIPPATILKN